MVGASKILTVSYGTFSCTLEGFDEPFSTMKAIAEYFRDLAADDRYFGAEPPTPDAAMLHQIAEREIKRRVEAKVQENGIILRADDSEERPALPVAAAAPAAELPAEKPAAVEMPAPVEAVEEDTAPAAADIANDSVAAKLLRIRAAVASSREAETAAAPSSVAPAPFTPARVAFAPAESEAEAPAIAAPAFEAPAFEAPVVETPAAEVPTAEDQSLYAEDQHAEPADGFGYTLSADAPAEEAPVAEVAEDIAEEAPEAPVEEIAEELEAEDAELAADLDDGFDDEDAETAPEPLASTEVEEVSFPDDNYAIGSIMSELAAEEPAVDADDAELADFADAELASDIDAAGVSDEAPAPEFEDADTALSEADWSEEDQADAEALAEAARYEETLGAALEAEAEAEEYDEEDLADLRSLDGDDDVEAEAAPEVEAEAEYEAEAEFEVEAVAVAVAEAEDLAASAPEAEAPAEPEPEVSDETAEKIRRARARVIRVRRDDNGTPVASLAPSAPVEEAKDSSGLSPEDEDELLKELAEVERDMGVTGGAASEGRQILAASAPDGDEAVSRLLDRTNSALEGVENRRRHSTISHLKAAVAATQAEKELLGKDMPGAEDGPTELDRYRDDLAQVVRPRRPTSSGSGRRGADSGSGERLAPLVLISEQRVDQPRPAPAAAMPIRPRRVTTGNLALDEDLDDAEDDADSENFFSDSNSFSEFAERMGATTLPDLLEAAAAYAAGIEGRPHFSRPQIMRQINEFLGEDAPSQREEVLRSFGMLLRQGRMRKINRGQFAVTPSSRYLSEAAKFVDQG